VLANPVSGERMRFVQTAADTGGCLLEWDHILAPGARVPAEHIHRVQQERFEVLAGTARVRCARDSFDLHEGESVVIPAGTRHGLRNDTGEQVTVRCQLRPAMRTAEYFELVCALAVQGKVSRRGIPSPLRGAVILVELGQQDYLPAVPIVVQQGLLAALAWTGRCLGVRARLTT